MIYTQQFTDLWLIYPRRSGGNPKPKAFKAFNARIKEKVPYEEIRDGLRRYSEFCKQTCILNTPYVMQAATFFSANTESWCEEWSIPEPETKKTANQKEWPPNFDPSRQCGGGESVDACKIRAWREYERRS